jgi:hypothetical protein
VPRYAQQFLMDLGCFRYWWDAKTTLRKMFIEGGVGGFVTRCMHPELESARKELWERPDEDGRKGRQPRSVGQPLGKPKWEKPVGD